MFNFKELIGLWKTDNLLTQALNDSNTMLIDAREMLQESMRSLRQVNEGKLAGFVYKKDVKINTYQREVRRKVLKHLAITGGTNIIPGLILTTIVIDIERLGDYCKNIMDLAVEHPKKLVCGTYEDEIQKIEKSVLELYDQIVPAIKNTDKKLAQHLIKDYWHILWKCDEIATQLIHEKDPSLGPGDAVTTALYVRYLKRAAAHLINIATSVVNPFENISFYEKEDGENEDDE